MDWESDEPSGPVAPERAARMGRVAFVLIGVGAGLNSLAYLGLALGYLSWSPALVGLLHSDVWEWAVGTPALLANVSGSALLVGLRPGRGWRLRATALFLIYLYVLFHWSVRHAQILGLPAGIEAALGDPNGGSFFFLGLGLAAMLTICGLASEVAAGGEGTRDIEPIQRAARGASTIGLGLWALLVIQALDWAGPWPPKLLRINAETFHLLIGAMLGRAIGGFFTALLCVRAASRCSGELDRLAEVARLDDPFRSRSEIE